MRRRSFLKSVLGFLALLFVPKANTKTIIKKSRESDIYSPNNPTADFAPHSLKPIWICKEDLDFYEGDQWTQNEIRRMVKSYGDIVKIPFRYNIIE